MSDEKQDEILKSLGRIEGTLPNLATKECLEKTRGKIKVNEEKIAVNRKGIFLVLGTVFAVVGKMFVGTIWK